MSCSDDDILTGGLGADTLTGGIGFGHFVYENLNDSTGTQFDTIQDFTQGQDVIDLVALNTFGIDSFTDITITQDTVSNETIITANDNAHADATEHFELHLKGIIDLHQTNFAWE